MERILTLNIGATRLALAEFQVNSGRAPTLLRYTFGELPEGLAESTEAFGVELEQILRGMMSAAGIRAGRTVVALSGQMAFPRFVKVLAETPERMDEQIRFEVEQNVPFPMAEAVYSHALVGAPLAGEQHVMIIAARAALVDAVTKALFNVGCEPEFVDVAPVALYNAMRFNYPDADGCTLVVDIGAKCTNLVFVEQDRIFYRTIPVAGNTITSEIAKAFGISAEDAEYVKREQGLVAQGGAFAVDDPEIDRLSKVIRNVMTRLNAEVMRSISFYRGQQEGSAPTRVLLTGASSQLPYMQNFFEEKLQVEVDFFNPFLTVGYPKHVDAEQFGRDAFSLPVLVGLALRRGLVCPMEINLVSQELIERKAFRRRLPFLGIAAAGLVVTAVTWMFYLSDMTRLYSTQRDELQARISAYQSKKSTQDAAVKKVADAKKRMDAYLNLVEKRNTWMTMLTAVDKAIPDGMWITSLQATRSGTTLAGLDVSLAHWADLKDSLRSGEKSIPETTKDALIATEVFGDKTTVATVDQQTSPWLWTFHVKSYLKNYTPPAAAKPTRGRR